MPQDLTSAVGAASQPRVPEVGPTWRRLLRWGLFPVVVLVVFCTLVGLDLSGSSIGVVSPTPQADGLIAGTPREIRSDEYILRTPNAISSVGQGLPTTAWIGLAEIDQAVAAGGGPTLDWGTLFKPQDWGYVLLGASRGLAVIWWASFAFSLWGAFALFGVLTRRPVLSAGFAVAATFTPYSGWWFAPSLTLGYAALAAAAVLGSWIVRRRGVAAVLAAAAGLIGAAFALTLYPPWQVSLIWVIVALGAGFALDRRIPWRRFIATTGLALAVAGTISVVWLLQHSAATQAVAGTYYPGQRRVHAGTGSLEVLLGAPLNFWMTGDAGATLGTEGRVGPYANLSESASSWFPLPLVLLLVVGAVMMLVRQLRRRGAVVGPGAPESGVREQREPVWMLVCVSAAVLLLLAWTLLPLPDWVGVITQLQRVQPSRTALALGFAALILVALASTVRARPRAWAWPWLLLAVLASAATTLWSAQAMPWNTALVSLRLVLVSGLLLAVLFAAVMDRRSAAAASVLLGLYAFASWAAINPLQQGIGPYSNDPFVQEMQESTLDGRNPRVMVFGDFAVVAKVRAAGLQSISGTTPYPDADLMRQLAPEQEELWNNYAQYAWIPAPAGAATEIERVVGSLMSMTIDPCNAVIDEQVDPAWAVADQPLEAECLSPISTVHDSEGRELHIYAVR
ncbi:DUF7657 domain-containing protein [Microterricola viridarii]|uniref:4-amino-4-deoxy-L-arabinose transferase n=1 Tax=Microterricola viridarii TaxID=412690 RepID=A0A1H1ZIM9_9MICO|nr:hypothetical protein [Microterricola viridarii]SDT33544.1 hypothetical protein SAMN04489834_3473 [Microterricola viridarii]